MGRGSTNTLYGPVPARAAQELPPAPTTPRDRSPMNTWSIMEKSEGLFYAVAGAEELGPYSSAKEALEGADYYTCQVCGAACDSQLCYRCDPA